MKIIIITIIMFATIGSAYGEIIVSCSSAGTCNINTYKSGLPVVLESTTIRMIPQKDPIPEDNIVEFELDKVPFTMTCDGSWSDLPTSAIMKDQMSCTVDRGISVMSGTAVEVSMVLYDQNAYASPYAKRPSDDYIELNGTSEINPYCASDSFAKACKWQVQNTNIPALNAAGVPLNNWVVMSNTTVTGLRLGYTIDDMPFETGETYCLKDKNGNTLVDPNEFWKCMDGSPDKLCPEEAVDCYPKEPSYCVNGGTLNTGLDRCISNPMCPAPGMYIKARNRCETSTVLECTPQPQPPPSDPPEPPVPDVCVDACPDGYSKIKLGLNDICVSFDLACDPAATLKNNYCDHGEPECVPKGDPNPDNLVYNSQKDACYIDGYPCPYGGSYNCTRPDGYSKDMCSPISCGTVTSDETPMGADNKVGDGEVDADGNCLDNVYIFSGRDERCRSGGVNLGFDSCCKEKSTFFNLFRCREHERQLSDLKDQELCIQVGSEYCSKKINYLVGTYCVEYKQTYCCFASQMSKLVNLQGREQLKTIDFGTAKKPNCRGFTPEEFQALDFSEDKIDLSAWYDSLTTTPSADVNRKISDRINDFYNQIK
ncbi:MAG: conjugal transfer protein TraN [Proteobacteria bacterium]|nr:conjugal transfer protein TraN [Pseudomonadota bacterium]